MISLLYGNRKHSLSSSWEQRKDTTENRSRTGLGKEDWKQTTPPPCIRILKDKTLHRLNYMQMGRSYPKAMWHDLPVTFQASSVNTSPGSFVLPGTRDFSLLLLIKQNIDGKAKLKKRLQGPRMWIQIPALACTLAVWSLVGFLASLSLFPACEMWTILYLLR